MNKQLILEKLPLPDLTLIHRNPIMDQRGFLQRLYCQDHLKELGIHEIAQINLTFTLTKGTVRGMHFQYSPHAETKIVSCLRGKVFDVVIDLRINSPTYLKWYSIILSKELNTSLLIPKGFAHGFQTLTEECELLYFHSTAYHKESEGGISPFDPLIEIQWPLAITDISDRDRGHTFLTKDFQGFSDEM